MSAFLKWLQENDTLVWSLTAVGVVVMIVTLVAIPWLIVRLPADYFVRRPVRDWPSRRPTVHMLLVIAKNLLGLLLLLAAIAMLILPGQGLLTMLIGIILLDFPGKRRLERWLIMRRPIRRTTNWIRTRYGRPPLQLPR